MAIAATTAAIKMTPPTEMPTMHGIPHVGDTDATASFLMLAATTETLSELVTPGGAACEA